ncbi:hypothetical protein PB2503_02767 [Parvularcula bermudensis HTCC2503]|uniref:Lipoprotein n=2 Tax=Parvularcula TaxID=208215 RepID=E0TCP1_PARBH|nr:hypothetical protein PB2503_02767 [Parvularcula bermudensis HTCC2503]
MIVCAVGLVSACSTPPRETQPTSLPAGDRPSAPGVSGEIDPLVLEFRRLVAETDPFSIAAPLPYSPRLPALDDNALTRRSERLARLRGQIRDLPPPLLTKEAQWKREALLVELDRRGDRLLTTPSFLILGPTSGPDLVVTQLPDLLPFTSAADYRVYFALLRDTPRFLREAQGRLDARRQAVTAQPCLSLYGVEARLATFSELEQIETILMRPFTPPAPALGERQAAQLRAEAAAIIAQDVGPALAEFRRYVETTITPTCQPGEDLRLAGLDLAAYQGRLGDAYGAPISPAEAYGWGLARIGDLRADLTARVLPLGYGSLPAYQAGRDRLAADGFPLDSAIALLSAITPALSREFLALPEARLGIGPMAPGVPAAGRLAVYSPASPDGRRPAVLWLAANNDQPWVREDIPALIFHNAAPGQHFAYTAVLAGHGGQSFIVDQPAFFEGWGLYATGLGAAFDLDNAGRTQISSVSHELLLVSQMVVDLGLHIDGWTPDRARDYLMDVNGLSRERAMAMVADIVARPGRAAAPVLGARRLREERAAAAAALGPAFDEAAFHQQIFALGPLPMSVLSRALTAWRLEGGRPPIPEARPDRPFTPDAEEISDSEPRWQTRRGIGRGSRLETGP